MTSMDDRSRTHIRLNVRARRKPHKRATSQRKESSPPEISRLASRAPSPLELDHDCHVDELLISSQVGKPHAAALCAACRLRAAEARLHGRIPVVAGKELRK